MKGQRVSKNNKCPICNSDSWCLIVGDSVLCMRSVSDRPHPMPHGTGYWHRIGDAPTQRTVHFHDNGFEETVDFEALFNVWRHQTMPSQIFTLSQQLGVRASALMEMGACYAENHKAWAFPMTDGFGRIVGARLRNWLGDKWAVKGSKSGIFMPQTFRDKVAIIVEGPTDASAVMSMGSMPIGRPSCSGGVVEILHAIGRWRILKVLIIADNDEDRTRPDGKKWNPGMDGAKALQAQLPVPSCLVVLPVKDIREFVKCGGQPHDLECLAQSMEWQYPSISRASESSRRTSPERHSYLR